MRRQRTLADPLIDPRLFREPGFSTALGINTLAYFVILGMLLLISQYLQLVLGMPALRAGLWMLPTMGGLIGGSLVTPLSTRRLHPAFAMAAGLAVAATGFGLLTQTSALGLAAVVTGSAVFGLGLAPVTNLVVGLVLGSAPPQLAGAASGLSETSTEFGGALGIAILGSVGTAVYHYRVVGHIPPGSPVPPRGPSAPPWAMPPRPRDSCTGRPQARSSHLLAPRSRAEWTSWPASARSSWRPSPWSPWCACGG